MGHYHQKCSWKKNSDKASQCNFPPVSNSRKGRRKHHNQIKCIFHLFTVAWSPNSGDMWHCWTLLKAQYKGKEVKRPWKIWRMKQFPWESCGWFLWEKKRTYGVKRMFRKRHCQSSEADLLRPCTRSSGGACGREHRETLADPCTVFAVAWHLLHVLCIWTHWILRKALERGQGAIFVPILESRKLRHREVKKSATVTQRVCARSGWLCRDVCLPSPLYSFPSRMGGRPAPSFLATLLLPHPPLLLLCHQPIAPCLRYPFTALSSGSGCLRKNNPETASPWHTPTSVYLSTACSCL